MEEAVRQQAFLRIMAEAAATAAFMLFVWWLNEVKGVRTLRRKRDELAGTLGE